MTFAKTIPACSLGLICWLLVGTVWGQAAAAPEKITLPELQNLTLTTKDGVQLRCTYLPGGVVQTKPGVFERKESKKVVPIIMLHGGEGRRADFSALAFFLQNQGHAVILPDLRGYGESTTIRIAGKEETLNRDRFRKNDYAAMVFDVEAVKRFLLDRNNAGELNIEMLCVIGADLGSIVAVNWAALDWQRRDLIGLKQGKDVKALVLLSPSQSYKGFSMGQALQNPAVASRLSMMIIYGQQDRESASDAKAILKRLERFHPEPAPSEVAAKKDLFEITRPTDLHGTALIDPRAMLGLQVDISKFIDLRLVSKAAELNWSERKNPLDASE
jgi:pimeloyl-ACP methyl ester carboxylesterase